MRRPSMTTSRAVYAPIYGWDHCLPHWTTPERSEARYVVTSAGLQLRIAADQLDWRPRGRSTARVEYPGRRVPRRTRLPVRYPPPSVGWVDRTHPDPDPAALDATRGRVDVTVSRASTRAACWPHGSSAPSTKTSTMQAKSASPRSTRTRSATRRLHAGLKAHGDPRLTTDTADVTLPFNASKPHTGTHHDYRLAVRRNLRGRARGGHGRDLGSQAAAAGRAPSWLRNVMLSQ